MLGARSPRGCARWLPQYPESSPSPCRPLTERLQLARLEICEGLAGDELQRNRAGTALLLAEIDHRTPGQRAQGLILHFDGRVERAFGMEPRQFHHLSARQLSEVAGGEHSAKRREAAQQIWVEAAAELVEHVDQGAAHRVAVVERPQ